MILSRVKMLRPLELSELKLQDPMWVDDKTISFYVPAWFCVDTVFERLYVETTESADYINLYCKYNTQNGNIGLEISYINNSDDSGDKEIPIELDKRTYENLKSLLGAINPEGLDYLS